MTYDASECTWMHLEGGCGWVRSGAVGCGWVWLGVETRCTPKSRIFSASKNVGIAKIAQFLLNKTYD